MHTVDARSSSHHFTTTHFLYGVFSNPKQSSFHTKFCAAVVKLKTQYPFPFHLAEALNVQHSR